MAARSALKRFGKDQSGATAIEYGLIVSLIFVVIVSTVGALAKKNGESYDSVAEAIGSAI